MKRILIFSMTYHPFIGGAEVAVNEITKRMPDMHFDMITLRISKTFPHFEKIGNVNVHRIGFASRTYIDNRPAPYSLFLNKMLFPIMAFAHGLRLHKKHHYDAVWSIMAAYAGFATLLFKLSNPKVPFLLTLQEGVPLKRIKKIVKLIHPFFKMIFTRADSIQAISHYLADFAKDMGHTKKIYVVPNGVDTRLFDVHFSGEEVEHYKNIVGKQKSHHSLGSIDPENIILVTTSRLVEKNAVDIIIKAMPLLPDSIKLLIIGDGPDMSKLKELADEMPDEKITFFGHLPNEQIPKYLKACDIFIRPSRSEGFGISFIEAMATGIPVITTPVGGIVDFLFDPERNISKKPTGLFCEVDNPQSLARAVMRYIHNDELRKTIVMNAKEMVKEKYDWKLVAEQMREVFNNVLQQKEK